MRKAKKKNLTSMLILVIVGIVSVIILRYILNTNLANRNLELFPFFGLFLSFIFFLFEIGTFFHIRRCEREIKKFKDDHANLSKLFFASTNPKDETNILSVIFSVEEEWPISDTDDYGEFIYIFDKHDENDKEICEPTEITVAPRFSSNQDRTRRCFPHA